MSNSLFNIFWDQTGLAHLTLGNVVMWLVGLALIYLAIRKKYEPLLLLLVPKAAPLVAMFMVGNLFRESKVVERLTLCAQNDLLNLATIFLGVSAVPMAARVSEVVSVEANPKNHLLMHAMGPNVAGVIGTLVAAGCFLALL